MKLRYKHKWFGRSFDFLTECSTTVAKPARQFSHAMQIFVCL